MPITLRQLRYFDAVVQNGSLGRAAESIFVSQPALSLQIRELEAACGAPLFLREGRGLRLTMLGQQAHEQTLRILDEVLLLETMGKRFESGPFRVVFGIVSTLAPYLLPGLLEHLRAARPRIELDVREAPSKDLVSGVQAGHLNAALLSVPLGLMELAERELFEDRLLLAGRADRLDAFRALGGSSPSAEDLAQSDIGPLLSLGEGHCLGDQIVGACSTWRMEEVHRGAGSVATLARLAASGAGLTLLPETAAPTERAASPDLGFLRFAHPEPSRRIGLVCHVASEDLPWFDSLAEAVAEVGRGLTGEAREAIAEVSPTAQSS